MATSAPDEVRALARLAFDELRGGVGGIEQLHRAVAARAFDGVGVLARPVRAAHDAVSGGVYAALRGAGGAVGRRADAALARRPVRDGRGISASPGGALAIAVLNGLIG